MCTSYHRWGRQATRVHEEMKRQTARQTDKVFDRSVVKSVVKQPVEPVN
jgi:hypothetical protein